MATITLTAGNYYLITQSGGTPSVQQLLTITTGNDDTYYHFSGIGWIADQTFNSAYTLQFDYGDTAPA